MDTAPCYGCPEREIGCHGKCEAYKEYRATREKEYSDRRTVNEGTPDIPSGKKQRYLSERTRMQRKGYLK